MLVQELIDILNTLPKDMECMAYYEDAQEFRPLKIVKQLLVDVNLTGQYSDRDAEEYSTPITYDTDWKLKNKQAYTEYINSLKSKPSKSVILFKPDGGNTTNPINLRLS